MLLKRRRNCIINRISLHFPSTSIYIIPRHARSIQRATRRKGNRYVHLSPISSSPLLLYPFLISFQILPRPTRLWSESAPLPLRGRFSQNAVRARCRCNKKSRLGNGDFYGNEILGSVEGGIKENTFRRSAFCTVGIGCRDIVCWNEAKELQLAIRDDFPLQKVLLTKTVTIYSVTMPDTHCNAKHRRM